MRRTMDGLDKRVKFGSAVVGVALTAGLAGWGGSMIAMNGTDTAAASSSTVQDRPTGGAATSATTGASPTAAARTQPTATPTLAPPQPARASASPARPTGGTPNLGEPVQLPPPRLSDADIVFVDPWRDYTSGQWTYHVGLLGFPADTVVEISGSDTHGNVHAAPLVMTSAEGSWNPFATRFVVTFAYGGTCDDADPATVTARGQGFSVTETAPRPAECDGGTTPDGPWPRPIHPTPQPAPAPPPAPGSGGP
ncbi:hypothetical protein GCU60_18550 [Blastococcus saxobsidens]|uniref:Uncharacterized protein n=1 Tax=Blastococcus saxobsidens TaxID=138336 RepID=A0A6L9W6M5_9ACTN|nr:hypothetical protein [Blastococcus saxobsidens]NEK87743.1 hypothetical protein [Blastococcus saxobsidens]